jgi:NAD(P)-dependent dehydrogenase (short-subunit alcohol dehydrogenase family)
MLTSPLTGKVAIVTGAARNMGRAFAEGLAADGASVVIHYNSNSSKADAEAARATIESAGGQASLVQADLTDVKEVERLFAVAIETYGGVDILVNNAGDVVKKPIADVTEDEYDHLFAVNTKAPFFAMRAAARSLRDGGRVINLGTTLLAATTGLYGAYAGSKAPLEDFTRALAKEIGRRGITVNTVAPGPIDTGFFHGAETPESVAYLSQGSVSGELGTINQITPIVRFLASAEAQWITAQTIFVNGGFAAR